MHTEQWVTTLQKTASFKHMDTLTVKGIEYVLCQLQVTASIARLSSCHIIMAHLFALYSLTHYSSDCKLEKMHS